MHKLSAANRREVATILRRLLQMIDEGDLFAPDWYRAYLAGTIVGLDS
jgi:hypothetical protein